MSTIQTRYWLEKHRTRNYIPLSWNDQFFSLSHILFFISFVFFRRYQSNLKMPAKSVFFRFWFKKQKKVKKERKVSVFSLLYIGLYFQHTHTEDTCTKWLNSRKVDDFLAICYSVDPSNHRSIDSLFRQKIHQLTLLPFWVSRWTLWLWILYNYDEQQSSTKMDFDCV